MRNLFQTDNVWSPNGEMFLAVEVKPGQTLTYRGYLDLLTQKLDRMIKMSQGGLDELIHEMYLEAPGVPIVFRSARDLIENMDVRGDLAMRGVRRQMFPVENVESDLEMLESEGHPENLGQWVHQMYPAG